jgi:hypothetical protein
VWWLLQRLLVIEVVVVVAASEAVRHPSSKFCQGSKPASTATSTAPRVPITTAAAAATAPANILARCTATAATANEAPKNGLTRCEQLIRLLLLLPLMLLLRW